MKTHYRFFLLWLLFIPVSCTSSGSLRLKESGPEDFRKAALAGMIYNLDRSPCPGVTVTLLDGRSEPAAAARTDGAGRFILDGLPRGMNRILLEKAGWEPQVFQIEFDDPARIFYARLTGYRDLLTCAERALDSSCWEEAELSLGRAEAVMPGGVETMFLRAVLARGRGQAETARQWLHRIRESGISDPDFLKLAEAGENHE